MFNFTLKAAILAAGLVLAGGAAAQDTVVVGVTTTGVPFTFVDTATQKPTGAMVDLAAAILADNALTPRFDLTTFAALIPALTTKKIDLVSAGMLVTDKRKETVDFSLPVFSYGEALIVAAGDQKTATLDDLKGETVGAQVGTSFAEALQKTGLFKEVKLYDSIADIMREVKLGRVKAGFGDMPIVAYQLARNPDLGVRMVPGYSPLVKGDVALALRKDDGALLAKVNASIEKLKASGKLKEIFTQYGLAD